MCDVKNGVFLFGNKLCFEKYFFFFLFLFKIFYLFCIFFVELEHNACVETYHLQSISILLLLLEILWFCVEGMIHLSNTRMQLNLILLKSTLSIVTLMLVLDLTLQVYRAQFLLGF